MTASVNDCAWDYCESASGNISSDPVVDIDGRLQSGSPCINQGVDPSTLDLQVWKDIDGQTRPQESDWDIGADEYVE